MVVVGKSENGGYKTINSLQKTR